MARKIQHKRGLEANLPQLDVAEIAFTTDSKKPFIGSADGNVEIAKKADVDEKASKTELTNAVSPKADKTYVDTELGKKASTDEVSAVSAQLADTEQKTIISSDFVRVGKIDIQDDFPGFKKVLPFDLYRDGTGIIRHTFNIEKEKVTANELYISNAGNNSTGDGTKEKPLLSFQGAINKAIERGITEFSAVFIDKIEHQDAVVGSYDLTPFKKVVMKPEGNTLTYLSRGPVNLTFTKDVESYHTTQSAVLEVLDLNNLDYRGIPKRLTKVSSKSECDGTPGSFFVSGSDVWVHLFDGREPNLREDVILVRDIAGANITLGDTTLVISDIFMTQQGTPSTSRATDVIKVAGTQNSKLILNNFKTTLGALNGIATSRVGEVYSFDSTATLAGRDGFNYHGRYPVVENPYEFVFEYNCHSYQNGEKAVGTCNATTAHDGMTVLRVNSVGYKCAGPQLADVNGCDTLNYDCVMYDAVSGSVNTKAAFWFDQAGAVKQGKAVLINCSGGGKDTHSINSDGSASIFVKKFQGNRIPEALSLSIVD